ncbi:GPW/gp25 family protein [Streptomyces sp. NPDC089799]|uniref:GPW/gp25 family protein n=1 Tax=Streptomyces sp. NPDC089799 TaxID=3155066 RepID=UPI003416C09C
MGTPFDPDLNVDFPFRVGADGRTALTGPDDHVRDLVEQVLFTSPGERVNRPDFGCGLLDLVFEPCGPDLAAALRITVQGALHRWLGDVVAVQALDVTAEDSALRIEIRYAVLTTGTVRTDTFATGAAR